MDYLHILIGDSLTVLPTLAAESVQCCVTSPPYWGLRDYDHPAQVGAEPSPELYVENLVAIFREVRRVLRKDGTVWLNVGDGYARNGGTGNCGPNAVVGNTKKLIQKRNCKVPHCWGLKDRDLMGLPWRIAFALQADGWVLRSKITWIKKTAMPESVKNRPTSATEEIFLLAKSPTYFYDANGVREASGANLRNYWILGPDPSANGHPAAFPRELVRRCILLGSREGDTILDPFAGSGTTGLAANELGRRAILIELNPAYVQMCRKRTRQLQLFLNPESISQDGQGEYTPCQESPDRSGGQEQEIKTRLTDRAHFKPATHDQGTRLEDISPHNLIRRFII